MTEARMACATAPGPRDKLEDAFAAFRLSLCNAGRSDLLCGLVCDGVGGNSSGELASSLALSSISSSLAGWLTALSIASDEAIFSPAAVQGLLSKAFRYSNRLILQQAARESRLTGMSTTAVCALLAGGDLHVAWVGDSRCYLCRGKEIRQLTHDHSEMQELVDAGVISPEHAQDHPLAHVITRCLGMEGRLEVDVNSVPLRQGDLIMLCTDGLTDVLEDREILEGLQAHRNRACAFEELPQRLVWQALCAGTTDNVTVLCCECAPETRVSGRTLIGDYQRKLAHTLHSLHQEVSP